MCFRNSIINYRLATAASCGLGMQLVVGSAKVPLVRLMGVSPDMR